MRQNHRLVIDLAPLICFFVANKLAGIGVATAVLMVVTLASLTVVYVLEKKVAFMPLVSGVAVGVLGGLTIAFHDDYFIKIKPTVVNCIFAAILLGSVYLRKSAFKYILGHALSLEDEGWRKLSLRWGLFFLFLACVNEVVWRNFSTDFWVNFKVFGMFSLTMVFTVLQLPLIKRYWVENEA